MKSGITWRRTFPECAPGTDGVALFEGRVTGRVRLLAELPRDPKPWMWSVTDPSRTARLGRHSGRSALAPASHGPPDRTLAGAASAQAHLRSPAWCAGEVASACRGPEATTSAQPRA
jgi:hypothetical protein